ncbi:MAG: cytochrome b [Erythrobacter sp.]|jgi:cytochrome b561|nr:cytochrome b [Erythrobacter sp.]
MNASVSHLPGHGTPAFAALQRYNRVARALHWVIAILVIGNLLTGLLNDALEDIVRVIPAHKAIGMTVLALTILRILWRLTWKHPAYPESVGAWEKSAARAVQFVFYFLMLAMPVSGWIMASAGKYPLSWFGLVDLPKLAVTRADPAYLVGREAHEILGWLFVALIALHVGAALRHHLILKDNVLQRMT